MSGMRTTLYAAIIAAGALCACHTTHLHSEHTLPEGQLPDTLRVVTLYSPGSYFIYREEEMGYDFDMASRFAHDKGMVLDLKIAPSLAAAIEMLDSGKVDLIAYEVPVTAEYRDHVVACGAESVTRQVLVQPKSTAEHPRITDVTQLVGRQVYVEKDSKYHARLENLNQELGGGIEILPIDRDTLITEDLIAMVASGEIPLTIIDSDIARINKTYYPGLDISLEVSFPQRAAWGVSPETWWLGDTITAWFSEERPKNAQAALMKRYFELSKGEISAFTVDLSHGHISPFDNLFRKYASTIGWDWRLIAAQGFVETRFDSSQVSWAGAKGVMQIMPRTARGFGLSDSLITHNDPNIGTAVKIINSLDKSLASKVPDSNERKKFVVAAYNSGLAHILDAIALAKKHGYDPQKWDGQTSKALLLKSKPEYYNDTVVKYGYFQGRQTDAYVRSVFEFYDRACAKIPQ